MNFKQLDSQLFEDKGIILGIFHYPEAFQQYV
jgi:hypothetical protein